MGSLIGALYAVGYSPEEIKTYILTIGFDKMASNEMPREERYLVREKDTDASMINFKLAKDSLFYKSLPTNFTTPSEIGRATCRERVKISEGTVALKKKDK